MPIKEFLKTLVKPVVIAYPILIIIAIPALLVLNTYLNIKYFNRDVNHILRQNASNIAQTITPSILEKIDDTQQLKTFIDSVITVNPDFTLISVYEFTNGKPSLISSTSDNTEQTSAPFLQNLAMGMNQSFAGLIYDPAIGKNVWNVVVPITVTDISTNIISVNIKTEAVDAILSRTSRDSSIVLIGTVVAILILLTNHFLFYQRAMYAKQLKELDKMKDEFISLASHELRAPITAVIGYTELIRNKLPNDVLFKVKEDFDTLKMLGNDLNNLVNDLLDVSRIEQGRLQVTITDTDVNDGIKKQILAMNPLALEKKLSLTYTPVDLPVVKSDPDRVNQILKNLINNSIKYTLQGTVTVSAEAKEKEIVISIIDTGIGIPPDQIGKLFTKFHRVKDEKTKEVRGTGLGLWITKQLVETLGGKIFVESIYGSGSRFTFTIPIK